MINAPVKSKAQASVHHKKQQPLLSLSFMKANPYIYVYKISTLSLNCFLFSSRPARRRGIPLKANTVEELTQIIIVDKPGTLTKFLGKFAEYMHVVA